MAHGRALSLVLPASILTLRAAVRRRATAARGRAHCLVILGRHGTPIVTTCLGGLFALGITQRAGSLVAHGTALARRRSAALRRALARMRVHSAALETAVRRFGLVAVILACATHRNHGRRRCGAAAFAAASHTTAHLAALPSSLNAARPHASAARSGAAHLTTRNADAARLKALFAALLSALAPARRDAARLGRRARARLGAFTVLAVDAVADPRGRAASIAHGKRDALLKGSVHAALPSDASGAAIAHAHAAAHNKLARHARAADGLGALDTDRSRLNAASRLRGTLLVASASTVRRALATAATLALDRRGQLSAKLAARAHRMPRALLATHGSRRRRALLRTLVAPFALVSASRRSSGFRGAAIKHLRHQTALSGALSAVRGLAQAATLFGAVHQLLARVKALLGRARLTVVLTLAHNAALLAWVGRRGGVRHIARRRAVHNQHGSSCRRARSATAKVDTGSAIGHNHLGSTAAHVVALSLAPTVRTRQVRCSGGRGAASAAARHVSANAVAVKGPAHEARGSDASLFRAGGNCGRNGSALSQTIAHVAHTARHGRGTSSANHDSTSAAGTRRARSRSRSSRGRGRGGNATAAQTTVQIRGAAIRGSLRHSANLERMSLAQNHAARTASSCSRRGDAASHKARVFVHATALGTVGARSANLERVANAVVARAHKARRGGARRRCGLYRGSHRRSRGAAQHALANNALAASPKAGRDSANLMRAHGAGGAVASRIQRRRLRRGGLAAGCALAHNTLAARAKATCHSANLKRTSRARSQVTAGRQLRSSSGGRCSRARSSALAHHALAASGKHVGHATLLLRSRRARGQVAASLRRGRRSGGTSSSARSGALAHNTLATSSKSVRHTTLLLRPRSARRKIASARSSASSRLRHASSAGSAVSSTTTPSAKQTTHCTNGSSHNVANAGIDSGARNASVDRRASNAAVGCDKET